MRFRISYIDPDTGDLEVVHEEFGDTKEGSARYWAEDYAYMLADKGWYEVEET